jgi:hypothetical protein
MQPKCHRSIEFRDDFRLNQPLAGREASKTRRGAAAIPHADERASTR